MNLDLPWRRDRDIPINEVVLIKKKDCDVPFLIIRVREYDMDRVNIMMGPQITGYGFELDFDEIECWLMI